VFTFSKKGKKNLDERMGRQKQGFLDPKFGKETWERCLNSSRSPIYTLEVGVPAILASRYFGRVCVM
jgi:hypothetical protein